MRLTALGGGAAPDLQRRGAGPAASRARARCSTRRRRSRSSATRCSRRRGPARRYAAVEAAGRAAVAPDDVIAGRPRARRRGPPRGADGRRDAARRARRPAGRRGAGRRRAGPGARDPGRRRRPSVPTASADRLTVRQRLDAGRPGLVALPVRTGESRASCSTARPRRLPARPARPGLDRAGRRARRGRRRSVRFGGEATAR